MKFFKKTLPLLLSIGFIFASSLIMASCQPQAKEIEKEAEFSPVTNFRVIAGLNKVTLYWTNPTHSKFSSLEVNYGKEENNLSKTKTLAKDKTSLTIDNLENTTTYYFVVNAIYSDDANTKKASETKSSTTKDPNNPDPSSVEMAKAMTIGWNLGNTLDADSETGWGAPKTTKAMIDAVAAAGFKTIRIPVSWSKHVDSSYNINSAWMNRVKEVVDYAVANDMYIILNVHHDNYSEADISSNSGFCITTNSTYQTKSKKYLDKVWTQIATTFAAYDEKIVFEVLNEPRAVGTNMEWYFPGGTEAKAKELCDVITEYEKTCISAIRGVPGNEDRFLMVPGYAASGADSTMLAKYTMPDNDTADDKLLLSTHAYSPLNFAMGNSDKTFGDDDKSSLDSIFNYLKTTYTDKGIGVVMGEASASNKGNTAERIKWAEYYFKKAKDAGIPVVLWDNMVFSEDGHENVAGGYNGEHHGWLCRTKGTWYFPTIIKAMMDTVGVTGYSIPEYVILTPENIGWNEIAATTVFTGNHTLSWTAKTFENSYFSGAKAGSILKISCSSATSGAIRMINSDWTKVYNKGEIVNAADGGENFNVSSGTTDVYYILTDSDANDWKTKGFGIAGAGLTITSIKFQN